MADSSEIGLYGTLRLLKRHEPATTVACFPIDDETVTFGRSKQCSIRLYYDCVSELHCTLQFSEERKAFLLVQGTNGLLVDGCQVNPSRSPGSGPTTVPLINGSEIEIYKKRFKFEYPPKEIRAALLATPRNARPRSSLRMSMIRSAQVFTPRRTSGGLPQTPPRKKIENGVDWEALRSPVKVPSHDGSLEQETTLLEGEGEDAIVVEEEKDIIVLQKVDNNPEADLSSPSEPKRNRGRSVTFAMPPTTPPPKPISIPQSAQILQRSLQTIPVNRRRSAPSLHRAVVLRSAQRALQRELEEEQEEDEVEAEVSPERELGPLEACETENDNNECDEYLSPETPPLIVPSNAPPASPERRMSAFMTSLDTVRKAMPSPVNWKAPGEILLPKQTDDHGQDSKHELSEETNNKADDNDNIEGGQQSTFHTPIRRNLGSFMTPQVQLNNASQRIPVDRQTRASLGGEIGSATEKIFSGAQRVRVVPAWKITDIILPEPEKPVSVEGKLEVKKTRISEEERQAIMARRKSALHTPSALPAPGPRTSVFPPPAGEAYTPGEDSDEDADTMLEKMTEKMASVRRKSEARKTRMSVGSQQHGEEFSLLASSAQHSSRGFLGTAMVEESLSRMQRLELSDQDVAGLAPPLNSCRMDDCDDLDLLEEQEAERSAEASMPGGPSLTPRFDGVRQMHRQSRAEPRTPSFTDSTTVFKETSETSAKTPSFRGIRELFKSAGGTGYATPRMDLGEMFDEDDKPPSNPDPMDERQTTIKFVKSVHESPGPTSVQKVGPRTRMATTSASKRSSRKKDVPAADVPSAVPEEQPGDHEDGDNDVEEVGPILVPTGRQATKRTLRHTITPTAGEAPSSGISSGHSNSRTTRKATAVNSEGTSKGIVVHKTSRTRRVLEDDSEDELAPSSSKTKTVGRGKRKHQLSESEMEQDRYETEIPTKPRASSRRAKETQSSDGEGRAPPKPHRGRAAKTPQPRIEPAEAAAALMIPKTTRLKSEESVDPSHPEIGSKAVKPKRGARTKPSEQVDEPPIKLRHSSDVETEDITPAPTNSRSSRKGWLKKTHVAKDIVSGDEKENSGHQQPKSSDKTPAIRTRRAAVTPDESFDAPAKRTRSRK